MQSRTFIVSFLPARSKLASEGNTTEKIQKRDIATNLFLTFIYFIADYAFMDTKSASRKAEKILLLREIKTPNNEDAK